MTSGATSSLHMGFVVAGLILQKGAKVGGNFCFRAKVHRDLWSRVGFGFGISVDFSPHPQHTIAEAQPRYCHLEIKHVIHGSGLSKLSTSLY
jgi:hypothetical protein